MKEAFFRFYAELNDFFPSEKDGKIHKHCFQGRQTIKDRIETLGVPHTEICLILKDGHRAVDFSYLVQNRDCFSVLPAFRRFKLPANLRLQPPYTGKPWFVADIHLGKLARYLRRLGFDTIYSNHYSDKKLAEIAVEENRILLTRDHGLLKRKKVVYGYFIRYDDPQKQLDSLYNRYQLDKYNSSTARCVDCNTVLARIDKEKIIARLEPKTKKYFNEFYLCSHCDKIYWKGSHFKNMESIVDEIVNNRNDK